jgi:uroporphyrinogen III methyltransferase/synthase
MGVRALGRIVEQLRARGDAPTTPVALVRWGTTTQQQVVTGTLETIEDEVARSGLKPPALIVVGEVVNLRQQLQWFDDAQVRPLWGKTIIVTRAREQASSLVQNLQMLGAHVVQCPSIRIEPLDDYSVLDGALHELKAYNWIVFSSANGVDYLWQRLRAQKMDARALSGAQVVAIGPATAKALAQRGIEADLVPESSISESVAQSLLQQKITGQRVLVARAAEGRDVLEATLRDNGVQVTVAPCYRTVPDTANVEAARAMMQDGRVDWVTFTSSSTVTNFVEAFGAECVASTRSRFRVACIGPVTAKTASELDITPDVVARDASVEALVDAITAGETT